ncbi:MAG: REP-associated tyrosine transposase [Arenimonas sp.]
MDKLIDDKTARLENTTPNMIENAQPIDGDAVRKAHVSIPGQAYLLTTTTIFRRQLFRDVDAARAAASVHNLRWVWRDSRVLAWVLMPSHWQGLIVLGPNDDLQKLMGRFKTATAKAMDSRYQTCGWVWGRGFSEQALENDAVLRDVGRHLITQPIRTGLVDEIGNYPYWDAVWLRAASDGHAWPGSRKGGFLK